MIYKNKFRKNNQGVSTVIGTAMFMILIIFAASILFLALYNYNNSVNQAVNIEELRTQERINLVPFLSDEGDTTTFTAVRVNNTGSITCKIRAVYVNNVFWCDPSDTSLNSDGAYITAQTSKLINILPLPYNPTDKITISTERGVKAIQYESNLIPNQNPPSNPVDTNYGPLRLNFTQFFFHETNENGELTGSEWQGWHVPEKTTGAWNITVTNIDNRSITLNQFSCLTIISNAGGSQSPWYINATSFTIYSNQTTNLIYIWYPPLDPEEENPFLAATPQSTPSAQSQPTCKVFLTFFGHFDDGKTYGQTIPFEAVLVDSSLN